MDNSLLIIVMTVNSIGILGLISFFGKLWYASLRTTEKIAELEKFRKSATEIFSSMKLTNTAFKSSMEKELKEEIHSIRIEITKMQGSIESLKEKILNFITVKN